MWCMGLWTHSAIRFEASYFLRNLQNVTDKIYHSEGYDAVAEDLMTRMLDFDPETRISV